MTQQKFLPAILVLGLAAGLSACASVDEGKSSSKEPRELSYTTGSNLPNRDRRGSAVKEADKDAVQESLNRAAATSVRPQ